MRTMRLWMAGAALVCSGWAVQAAEPTDESRKLAASIPIFDMHLHVYEGLTPTELQARMDRNGVQWGGGVGALNPKSDIAAFKAQLGDRYYPTLGQPELAASYGKGGVAAMTDLQHPMIQKALSQAGQMLPSRQAYGYGELILNNQHSHPRADFRRLAAINNAVVQQMFALSAEHGGMVQIHMEPHPASLQELRELLQAYPQVPVVVAHCLAVNTSPQEMEALFEQFPQVHCELSTRTPLTHPRDRNVQVYGSNFVKSDWLQSIERYADRYMVGTDVTSDKGSYDQEIQQIREGLLPRLSAETMQKVAHGNAQRVLKIAP
ncbi:MAG: amidohydrolase family protein [Comamonas sp.]